MTESLSGQFDGMLPGVDWSKYRKKFSLSTPEQKADKFRLARYQDDFPSMRPSEMYSGKTARPSGKELRARTAAQANVPLEGLHSAHLFYSPEQQAQVEAGLKKVTRVAQSRTPSGMRVPEGIRIRHSAFPNEVFGDRTHNMTLHDPELAKEGYDSEVGQVKWNGNTGRVSWLGVDEGYRHLVPHLLTRAHETAAEYGDSGPTHATNLSSFSYKLMNKFLPNFIDRENTTVDYEDLPPEPHR